MNGSEFAQYMPVDALTSTIAHVWETFQHSDNELYVLRTCWEALVASVGGNIALAEVTSVVPFGSVAQLMEVVS